MVLCGCRVGSVGRGGVCDCLLAYFSSHPTDSLHPPPPPLSSSSPVRRRIILVPPLLLPPLVLMAAPRRRSRTDTRGLFPLLHSREVEGPLEGRSAGYVLFFFWGGDWVRWLIAWFIGVVYMHRCALFIFLGGFIGWLLIDSLVYICTDKGSLMCLVVWLLSDGVRPKPSDRRRGCVTTCTYRRNKGSSGRCCSRRWRGRESRGGGLCCCCCCCPPPLAAGVVVGAGGGEGAAPVGGAADGGGGEAEGPLGWMDG